MGLEIALSGVDEDSLGETVHPEPFFFMLMELQSGEDTAEGVVPGQLGLTVWLVLVLLLCLPHAGVSVGRCPGLVQPEI